MGAELTGEKRNGAMSPASWFAGLALSLGALGLSGCGPEKKPEAPVVKKTEPYTDMGEGIYVIRGSRVFGSAQPFAENLAAWKKDYPNREITRIIPQDDRSALYYDVVIETREKPLPEKK